MANLFFEYNIANELKYEFIIEYQKNLTWTVFV